MKLFVRKDASAIENPRDACPFDSNEEDGWINITSNQLRVGVSPTLSLCLSFALSRVT